MKKIAYFVLGLVSLSVISCKDSKKDDHIILPADPRKDYSMQRTHEDTLAVLDLANKFLTALKEKNIDAAIDQLIEMEDSVAKPMSVGRKSELKKNFNAFPVESYTIDEMTMFSENDTEVRYTTKMFPDSVESKMPGTTKGSLHAFRIDNKWYLTILPVKFDTQNQEQIVELDQDQVQEQGKEQVQEQDQQEN